MTRVSKTNLVQKFRKEAWKKFFDDTNQASSTDTLIEKLRTRLSPSEILMLEKRLIISLLTEKGMGCREIGRLIDVSPNTVTFVKHHFARKILSVPKNPRTPAQRTAKTHRSSKGMGAELWK